MFYDVKKNNHDLPHDPFKAIVAPRPIGWISTLAANGDFNLAPYSFFNVFGEVVGIHIRDNAIINGLFDIEAPSSLSDLF